MSSPRAFIRVSRDSPKHRAPRPRRSLSIEYEYHFTEYEYVFEAFDGGVQRDMEPKGTKEDEK